MSAEFEAVVMEGPADCFSESAWASNADSLLMEMDSTTAEAFSAAVRGKGYGVLLGMATVYPKCMTRTARAKIVEGIMSVCAVVPESYELVAVKCPDALTQLVRDACGNNDVEGANEEDASCFLCLFSVVLLGQVAEYILDQARCDPHRRAAQSAGRSR